MKKILYLIIALLTVVSLWGCSGSSEKQSTNETEGITDISVNIAEVKTEILEKLTITGQIDLDSDKLLNQYGITEDLITDNQSFIVPNGIFPGEVVLLKAKDKASAGAISEKLNNRLDSLKIQSKDYEPESYKIAQECSVLEHELYIAMFFAADGPEMEEIYKGKFSTNG